jgi:hypothetical protein
MVRVILIGLDNMEEIKIGKFQESFLRDSSSKNPHPPTSISYSNEDDSNECKRRKIKCNGNTPCQRCGNLKLECQYAPNCCSNGFKDSDEFKQMNAQIASLQEQVNNLYDNLNALRIREGTGLIEPRSGERSLSLSQYSVNNGSPSMRQQSTSKHPRYQGPTSSAFNLAVAKNTLYNMGYPGLAEGGENGISTQDDTPIGSPPLRSPSANIHPSRDPLWLISKDEAVRLCRVYEEEMVSIILTQSCSSANTVLGSNVSGY